MEKSSYFSGQPFYSNIKFIISEVIKLFSKLVEKKVSQLKLKQQQQQRLKQRLVVNMETISNSATKCVEYNKVEDFHEFLRA